MSTADLLLSRLSKVKRTGPGKWTALCPAHDDRTPSLAVAESDSGAVLVHCFGGCDVDAVVNAVGLRLTDLFPPKSAGAPKANTRIWLPSDVFEMVRREVGIAAVVAADLSAGKDVPQADIDRLKQAAARLENVAEVAYGRR